MNSNNLNNSKVNLKPEELTFENILENGYTISDINKSLLQSNIENNLNLDLDLNIKNLNNTIHKNFKSRSSGIIYYNINSNSNNNYNSNENNNENSEGISNGISDGISDNLNNLLF